MNAAEQAKSIAIVSKIAAVVNLFHSQFPEVLTDFNPWVKNSETTQFDDPHSIDLAFHFSQRSFACQSRCILMQIRLPGAMPTHSPRVIGVELSGHGGFGQQWRFSTTGHWEFCGLTPPLPDAQRKLRQIGLKTLQLFDLLTLQS